MQCLELLFSLIPEFAWYLSCEVLYGSFAACTKYRDQGIKICRWLILEMLTKRCLYCIYCDCAFMPHEAFVAFFLYQSGLDGSAKKNVHSLCPHIWQADVGQVTIKCRAIVNCNLLSYGIKPVLCTSFCYWHGLSCRVMTPISCFYVESFLQEVSFTLWPRTLVYKK